MSLQGTIVVMYGGSFQRQRPSMPTLRPSDTPVTLILIGANVLTFLLMFFIQGPWLLQGLGLTSGSLRFPWTALTWPLLGIGGPLALVFNGLWAWSIGSSQERAWGHRAFLSFVLTSTLLTSVTVFLALYFLPQARLSVFGGLSMAMAPVTIAWCWINRRETIVFNFLFPIPALWIAGITAAFTFFSTAAMLGNPFAGIAGLSGCAYALWYARGGREWLAARFNRNRHQPNPRFVDLARDVRGAKTNKNPIQKAREEKERKERDAKIAEMFRNSGYKDDER